MIPIEYYIPAYYLIITLILVFTCLPLFKYAGLEGFPKANLKVGTILLLITTVGFIGLRDPWGHWSYFGDTGAYTRTFNLIKQGIRTEFNKDIGFYVFMKLCSQVMQIKGFYFLSALLYVGLPYVTFKKWFKQYAFFVLAAFITAMSFWSFGINGVRNGLATAIFIYALGIREKKFLFYLLAILSVSFHKSMLLPLLSYLCALNYKNTKFYLFCWVLAIPISFIVGQQFETFISSLLNNDTIIGDDRALTYFSGEKKEIFTDQRFRFDFVLYSAVPVLIGAWYLFKIKLNDNLFTLLFNLYLIANTVWILLIYVPFTNRVAYLSWFIMPIILIYPFLNTQSSNNNSIKLFLIIFGSLLFTLLIQF